MKHVLFAACAVASALSSPLGGSSKGKPGIERRASDGCGGLQPSELFGPTLQNGTDSVRSVASMEGHSSDCLRVADKLELREFPEKLLATGVLHMDGHTLLA